MATVGMIGIGIGVASGGFSPATAAYSDPSSDTTLGQTNSTDAVGSCVALTGFQQASTSTDYVAAAAGVITSWSHQAGPTTGTTIRFLVFRQTATAGTYDLVGKSATESITPSILNTFDVRIPVQAGDIIGMQSSEDVYCDLNGDGDDKFAFSQGTNYDADAGAPFTPTYTPSNIRYNLAALEEPDADADGYGDTTQDQCPSDATTQGACPVVATPTPTPTATPDTTAPETTLTKAPKKRMHKRQAIFKFTSTEPGSRFQCRMDDQKFNSCTSAVVEDFPPGKHTFEVRAIDAAGNVDQTPATVSWRFVPIRGNHNGKSSKDHNK